MNWNLFFKKTVSSFDWQKMQTIHQQIGAGSFNKAIQPIMADYMEKINQETGQENDLSFICYAVEFCFGLSEAVESSDLNREIK